MKKVYLRSLITPLLITLIPIIGFYTPNIAEITITSFFIFTTTLLLAPTLIFIISSATLKCPIKGSFFSSTFLIFFYFFHYLLEKFNSFTVNNYGSIFIRLRYIIIVISIFFIWLFFKLFNSKKPPVSALKIINIFFGIIFLFSISKFSREYYIHYVRNNESATQQHITWKKLFPRMNINSENKQASPDIYFIIVDEYSSEKVLSKYFNHENCLSKHLKKQGFYIAENSYSNYPSTYPSVAATLHMNYHPKKSNLQLSHFMHMIKNNHVFNFLKKNGYKIISIPSHLNATQHFDSMLESPLWVNAKNAYILLLFFLRPQSFLLYCSKLINKLDFKYKRNYIRNQIHQLKKTAGMAGPKFIFCHLTLPHPPFIFDKNGGAAPYEVWHNIDEGYIPQIKFTNSQIKESVKHILENSKQKPIIIVQGDHGIKRDVFFIGKKPQVEITQDLITQVTSIFNAYYFPDKLVHKKLYPSISPVNNFRLIFDHYFKTNLGQIENRTFNFQLEPNMCTFTEVEKQ